MHRIAIGKRAALSAVQNSIAPKATIRSAACGNSAATAVLNTGGNVGGVVATPAIAALSANQQGHENFALGAAASIAAAVLWFWVDIAGPGAQSQEVRI